MTLLLRISDLWENLSWHFCGTLSLIILTGQKKAWLDARPFWAVVF
jgi:hypothetical protein